MKVPRHLRSQRDTPQRNDHENDPWSRSQSQWKSGHGDHKQSHMPVIIKQDTLQGLIESHLNDLSGCGSYGLPFPAGEAERIMI